MNDVTRNGIRLRWSGLVLGTALVLQGVILARTHILPMARNSARVLPLSAVGRSARIAFGDDFAGYVEFLEDTIPIDAKVIVPPASIDTVLGNAGIVQYYLFPRRIDNCGADEIEACIRRVTGKNTYILAVPGFPPRELAGQSKDFLGFRGERGVFVPKP